MRAPLLTRLFERLLEQVTRLRTMTGTGERDGSSHTEQVSGLSCRNCHARLDYTDISCPACGRKTTQFSLR